MKHKKIIKINDFKYLQGQINKQHVVLAQSGMGIANISLTTSRMIQDMKPKQLYLLGSSGAMSPDMKKGMVVLGKKVTNVDFGQLTEKGMVFPFKNLMKNPQNNKQQLLTFNASISINKQLSQNIYWGHIATSEMLPNSPEQSLLLKKSGYDVVEMEGAGFMQMCWFYEKPCLVIRGVSNNTAEAITMKDVRMAAEAAFKTFCQIISEPPSS